MIIGFVSRASLLRLAALPLMVFSTYHQFIQLEQIRHPIIRAFFGAASVFAIVLYTDDVLLSQWTFDACGPTSSRGGLAPLDSKGTKLEEDASEQRPLQSKVRSNLRRFRFGLRISLQSRFPGTPWAVKNLPPFSRKSLDYVPTKINFLLYNMFKCCVYIMILRLCGELGNPAENPVLFSSARIPLFARLGAISALETKTRVLGVLGYWIVQYLVIEVLYSILAVVAVTLHVTSVNVWRPVFGWVDEAWSLRQFWG